MSKINRMQMVKAMEFIARNINDEEVFEEWLTHGVADGDIQYADLRITASDDDLEYYIKDRNFAYLMQVFLHVMKRACKSGGLYCDGVVSEF